MKYSMVFAAIFFTSFCVSAQKETAGDKNLVKVNLSALIFRNISVEYERALTPHSSLALNFHTIPYGSLPFQTFAQKQIDKAYVDVAQAKIGSVGATASYKMYSHKKGVFKGFYLAPMLQYSSYKSILPIQYDNGKTGLFNGNINTFSGGVQLGAQVRISGHLFLDIWIIGPSYGFSSGTLSFSGSLSVNEQAILQAEIEDLKNSLPIYVIKSYTITSTGASIEEQGPWAGLRGLGFSLGFRF